MFKDYVMQALLALTNIEVGEAVPFDGADDAANWPIELDLSGKFLSFSARRLTFRLVLAFRNGGHVVKSWPSISVQGKSREELLKNAATKAVGKVLAYLGAN